MTARLLVLGRGGQVAHAIGQLAVGYDVVLAGRDRLDLAAGAPDIAGLIADVRPAGVINAAGHTAVDRAELEVQASERLNRDTPAAMARACAAASLPFVHFSTDYVFDGEKGAPYVEDDVVRPLNVYGRTKAQGEALIADILASGQGRGAVIRTSWVYGPRGANFLRTMLRLAMTRGEISVVDDQHGRATTAASCARAALALMRQLLDHDRAATGLFHAAGPRDLTWARFAEAIFAASRRGGGPSATVRRISTAEYPTAAARPKDTRLASDRLEAVSSWRRGDFDQDLAECLRDLEPL